MTVAYSQVKELKGTNRSTAAKVGINVAKGRVSSQPSPGLLYF